MRTYRLLIVAGLLIASAACQPTDAGLRAGYAALEEKQYDQAVSAADVYLRQNPGGPGAAEAKYLRGRVIDQQTKHSPSEAAANLGEARTLYEEALRLNPSPKLQGYIQTSLGNVAYWQDDYPLAERYWSAALERLDNDELKAWVTYRLGMCQQRLGKWASADTTFSIVTMQWPDTEVAQHAAAPGHARVLRAGGGIRKHGVGRQAGADAQGQGLPRTTDDQGVEESTGGCGGAFVRLRPRNGDARARGERRIPRCDDRAIVPPVHSLAESGSGVSPLVWSGAEPGRLCHEDRQ